MKTNSGKQKQSSDVNGLWRARTHNNDEVVDCGGRFGEVPEEFGESSGKFGEVPEKFEGIRSDSEKFREFTSHSTPGRR